MRTGIIQAMEFVLFYEIAMLAWPVHALYEAAGITNILCAAGTGSA